MRSSRAIFWWSAIITAGLVAGLKYLNAAAWSPALHVLAKPGLPGIFGLLVCGCTLWSILALILRSLAGLLIRGLTASADQSIRRASSAELMGDMDGYLKRSIGVIYEDSILQRRVLLAQERLRDHNRADRALSLIGGQSGLDAARLQSSYGPLRALIWSLPAFGFMGTASEMAIAVGGLGASLSGTQDYNGLRNVLVSDVVPHLAGAFDITLLALAGSVICFLLLSIVSAREEDTMTELDEVCLRLVAKVDDRAAAGADPLAPAALARLEQAVQQLGQASRAGGLELIGERLQSFTEELGALSRSLQQLPQFGDSTRLMTVLESILQQETATATTLRGLEQHLEPEELVFVRRPRPSEQNGR